MIKLPKISTIEKLEVDNGKIVNVNDSDDKLLYYWIQLDHSRF